MPQMWVLTMRIPAAATPPRAWLFATQAEALDAVGDHLESEGARVVRYARMALAADGWVADGDDYQMLLAEVET